MNHMGHAFPRFYAPRTGKVMDKIAKYSIMGELGRGSEGVVYRALDVESQRQLALKVIRVNPELPDDDPDLLRLVHATEEQAKKLSGIDHRNVAQIFGAGYQDGVVYIARELIDGKTLKWFMEDTGRVKVEEAVEITKDLARGLKAIHQLGIVLGELKPSNIMIRPGIPVIGGLSIPAGYEKEGIVKTTKLVETVVYLAPEVVEGSLPTGRSDIYALGMILYSMLAGGNPFEATTVANALINVRVKGFPPVEEVNSKVPAWLARVVKKAISRNPDKRYGTVDEFLDDLTLRSILKESIVKDEDPDDDVDYQYLEDIKPRRKDKRLEYAEVAFVLLSFVAVIWILVHFLSPDRYAREAQHRRLGALQDLSGDINEGFDIGKFYFNYQHGNLDENQMALVESYSLSYSDRVIKPTGLEAIKAGGKPRTTFTLIAFPKEPNPNRLCTFAIREDHILREWQEGYGEFEDVTTWKERK